jgi:putative two-component system response regulator
MSQPLGSTVFDESPRARNPSLAADTSPPVEQVAKIMIVDDEVVNIKVARKYLTLAGYTEFVVSTDATQVITLFDRERPDLLLLDIMMPSISGIEILRALRQQEPSLHVPVLILTASDDRETRTRALNLGATDFLTKPVDPTELVPRVRNALVMKAHHDHVTNYARTLETEVRARTVELEESRRELIRCLARAAEYRDNETGRHVVRVGRYAGIIARGLGFNESAIEILEQAALLHDVGKIGIPDSILLKPSKLDPDELKCMQRHCDLGQRVFEGMSNDEFSAFASHTTLGAKIVQDCHSPVLELAARIALTHHEKWDGTGYPHGLSGNDIPLEGRITAVADVFDALSSKRPYKPAFPLGDCFDIMEQEREKHFDPNVLDAFFAGHDEIVRFHIECIDVE